METQSTFRFDRYELDVVNAQLRRGKQVVQLTDKALQVLGMLVTHAGQLVTKEAFFGAIWAETAVSDGVLTVYIRELRKVLKDDARTPRFIETVHRRGYRFIGQLKDLPLTQQEQRSDTVLVGRTAELSALHHWWVQALAGKRQVIFVTGEAGIGKTTLVEAFLTQLQARTELWVGRGYCVEQYGAGEPYLPILDALGRLYRGPGGKRLLTRLEKHAPSWALQMPALLSSARLHAVQQRAIGATTPRMLRELAEVLEVLTAEQPLALVLEDLQWSDAATLDLLMAIARRPERARLFICGTFRSAEVLVRGHRLRAVKQELRLHGACQELPLEFLSVEAIGAYLQQRFPTTDTAGVAFHQDLARLIHQRTDGNALFMVAIVDELLSRGELRPVNGSWQAGEQVEAITASAPHTVWQFIEHQLDEVSGDTQQILEAASVAGVEFSAAAAAAGVKQAVENVEAQCEALARHAQFLESWGAADWPDGTIATCYRFVHALYQEILYSRIPKGRRIGLHKRIGERKEVGYKKHTREIAAELAVHFERGREYPRAVHYLYQAGEIAIERSGHREAIELFGRGLALLQYLPQTPEQTKQELQLQISLGWALIATKGYAALEVEHAFDRARVLCQQVGNVRQRFGVVSGLEAFHSIRAEYPVALEFAEQRLHLARQTHDPALMLSTHISLGDTFFYLGELRAAQAHLEQDFAPYAQRRRIGTTGDLEVIARSETASVLWCLGYPDQASQSLSTAQMLACELSHPYSLGWALVSGAYISALRRDGHAAQAHAEALIALCHKHEFTQWLVEGQIVRGWALIEQGQTAEGMSQVGNGLDTLQAMGAKKERPLYLAQLAAAHGREGQTEIGLTMVSEALDLVQTTGERVHESELSRLKGELLLQQSQQNCSAAEECFHTAIGVARHQEAKSWELRAATSLARLWRQQGKRVEARELLALVYNWFTEGFATKDLQEAKELLEELS